MPSRKSFIRSLCKLTVAAALQGLMLGAAPAWAQAGAYPSKAVRVIAPFPPGQGTELIARQLSQQLTASMGQSFFVENRPGAGGLIGTRAAKEAPADGYTLLVAGAGPLAINPALYSNVPYDPLKDFRPVQMIAAVPNVLVVRSDFPGSTLREVVDQVKRKPGQMYGTSGTGVPDHLIMEMLKVEAGLDLTQVPYQGASAAIIGLISGDVSLMFATVAAVLPQIRSGQLKPIAVAGPRRALGLPDVPTIRESGFQLAAQGWSALIAPAGTPDAIVQRLHEETAAILARPEMQKTLIDLGVDPLRMTMEETTAYMKSEVENWARAVKLSGAKVN